MAYDGITIQMEKLLDDVQKEAHEASEQAIREVSKEAVSKLRSTSPKNPKGKHSGQYARGWKADIDGLDATVYNSTDPGLTHLLEKGHAIVTKYGPTGDRTEPRPHIKPVEEWAAEELPERIMRGLK